MFLNELDVQESEERLGCFLDRWNLAGISKRQIQLQIINGSS